MRLPYYHIFHAFIAELYTSVFVDYYSLCARIICKTSGRSCRQLMSCTAPFLRHYKRRRARAHRESLPNICPLKSWRPESSLDATLRYSTSPPTRFTETFIRTKRFVSNTWCEGMCIRLTWHDTCLYESLWMFMTVILSVISYAAFNAKLSLFEMSSLWQFDIKTT